MKRPIFSPLARTHEQRPMPLQQLDVGLFKHSKVDCQISIMISKHSKFCFSHFNHDPKSRCCSHPSIILTMCQTYSQLIDTEDTYKFYILKMCGSRSQVPTSSCFSSRSSVSFLQISSIQKPEQRSAIMARGHTGRQTHVCELLMAY